MNNKVYVGGLSFSVTDGQLQEIFQAHGTVESARVISARVAWQSRCFGFVEMGSASEAQKAIGALNGTQLEVRTLTVNEAKPIASRDSRGGGSGGRNRW